MPKTLRATAIDRGGALAPVPLAWFSERSYPGVLALCREGCLLPASWAEWRSEADVLEKAARERGSRVNWVEVAPGDLRHWAERRRWQFIDTARLNEYVRQMAGHRTPDSAGLAETPDAEGMQPGKRARATPHAGEPPAPAPGGAKTRSGRGSKKASGPKTPVPGRTKTPKRRTTKTSPRRTTKTSPRGTAKTPRD
jgi:hypothetical protein